MSVLRTVRTRMPRSVKDRLRPAVLLYRRLRAERPSLTELAWAQPMSFSQFGEDMWLARHFADRSRGFYVDVGAYHPYMASNTYLLYRRGWRGINIEPAPEHFRALQRSRKRDTNLCIAVSPKTGRSRFSVAGAFSGIDDDTRLWPGMADNVIDVDTKGLAEVLEMHLPAGTKIDLLDVDCEGHDLEILRSNDWARFRPEVVLVEHHDGLGEESPASYLQSLGYELRTRLDLTLIFVDGSQPVPRRAPAS